MKLINKIAISVLTSISVLSISYAAIISTQAANKNHNVYPSQVLSSAYNTVNDTNS